MAHERECRMQACGVASISPDSRNARRHDTPVDIRTELSTDARVHAQPSAPCSAIKQIAVGSRSFSASLTTTSGSSRAFSKKKDEMP